MIISKVRCRNGQYDVPDKCAAFPPFHHLRTVLVPTYIRIRSRRRYLPPIYVPPTMLAQHLLWSRTVSLRPVAQATLLLIGVYWMCTFALVSISSRDSLLPHSTAKSEVV